MSILLSVEDVVVANFSLLRPHNSPQWMQFLLRLRHKAHFLIRTVAIWSVRPKTFLHHIKMWENNVRGLGLYLLKFVISEWPDFLSNKTSPIARFDIGRPLWRILQLVGSGVPASSVPVLGPSNGVTLVRRATNQDQAVQTDFPAGMLEEYVVKNRRRILKLLGLTQAAGTWTSVWWNRSLENIDTKVYKALEKRKSHDACRVSQRERPTHRKRCQSCRKLWRALFFHSVHPANAARGITHHSRQFKMKLGLVEMSFFLLCQTLHL